MERELKKMDTCRIVFIVGPAHSGTTIIYRMLAQHPDVAWFSQYSMHGGQIPGRVRLPFYGVVNRLGKRFFSVSWKKTYDRKKRHSNRPGLIPTPTEPHQIWDYLLPVQDAFFQFFTESDIHAEMVSHMRSICFEEAHAWRKSYLLVKLPRLSQAARLLAHVFPEALFIRITRDGKAVALSTAHKFSRHGESKHEALYQSACHWRAVEEYITSAQHAYADRFITLSYESLCADVRGSILKMSDFAGLSRNAFVQKLPEQLTLTNERWFRNLSTDEKVLLNDILQPLLEKQGYALFAV
jgi:hypothetical protein